MNDRHSDAVRVAEVDCAHCGAKFTMKRAWQSFLAMLAVLQTGMNETQGNRLCQSNTDYRRGEFTTMRKITKNLFRSSPAKVTQWSSCHGEDRF